MITLESLPQTLFVGDNGIHQYLAESWDDIKRDPRGLLLMWEPPLAGAHYVIGFDPTEGITGWTRGTRSDGDHKTDNAAIEVFRINGTYEPVYSIVRGERVLQIDPATNRPRRLYKDVQVAEFAAPCDAVESARIAYTLGRIYAGADEDFCKLIWEAWPGPGLMATQELLRLNYSNMWMWQYIDKEAEDTDRPGWRSTATSQRLLWYRARRHLMNHQVVMRSPFLLSEYSNAEIDMVKMRAKAAYGYHDDRFQAANMAFWAGHEWAYDLDAVPDPVTTSHKAIDYQNYAPTLDSYMSYSDWKLNQTSDWDD